MWSQYLLPQITLTRLAGWAANRKLGAFGRRVVRWFVRHYGVDMSEALEPSIEAYSTFNEFFTRAIDLSKRPLCDEPFVASPADGALSQFGPIEHERLIQAKGRNFQLQDLLAGDEKATQTFARGHFMTIYLSPRDYHRVHMPLSGRLTETVYVPGRLFSVNPLTAQYVPNLFARNERLICYFETNEGPMAMILVGATIVGSIATVWGGVEVPPRSKSVIRRAFENGPELAKGEEMGRFQLGSTVIMLFPQNSVSWLSDLRPGQAVKVRQALAERRSCS